MVMKQGYMIVIGIVMAFIFTGVPEWTIWVLLIAMAIYDVVAVLVPNGPLKVPNLEIPVHTFFPFFSEAISGQKSFLINLIMHRMMLSTSKSHKLYANVCMFQERRKLNRSLVLSRSIFGEQHVSQNLGMPDLLSNSLQGQFRIWILEEDIYHQLWMLNVTSVPWIKNVKAAMSR